ncbi:glycerate kinase-like [Scleropages formosus]|uniref:Glycerate kinase n=1 Tax=Scleropages formosus TaxID=113540 RepID=A0A0P7XMJ4_SCLFO|nr:glycerate kinase [Scleropages formosus]XP_018617740.1 glycerate kinase [Scleropages formosus]XP_018617741.1 glycerate kinase [Scleropages formosus]XP_018617742.1 glycerate kinase [Scleropages formosus]KPP78042.1 glycerate kinase-like [Scleropages formosus]
MARVLSLCRSLPLCRPLVVRGMARRMMSLEERARAVFAAAVEGVQPDAVVRKRLQRSGDQLLVDGHCFPLQHNLHLVGFGKAVLGMAAEAERIVGDHLVQGVVSVPYGIQETLQKHGKGHMLLEQNSRIEVLEGAKHNLPDADAQRAAERIRQIASQLTETDLLLVLISGGGSALLPYPVPPISLEEKQEVTRKLAAAGATIQELNTVRRALSLLKGGGLAQNASPAKVIALILSDVIGDPLDLIASGPTVQYEASTQGVWTVLERYRLCDSLPMSVREVLGRSKPQCEEMGKIAEQEKNRVHNVVIGSNSIALEAAGQWARQLGLRPVVLSPGVCGDVCMVAHLYGLLARFASAPSDPSVDWAQQILQLGPKVGVESWDLCRTMRVLGEAHEEGWGVTCVLAGGEPTVQLIGKGRGGRNQELALRVGLELGVKQPLQDTLFLSGGTDGQDGPTDAAGAVTDGGLEEEARRQGLDPSSFLSNNDSYTFFSRLSAGRCLLLPGLTGTNVMDVHLLLIPTQPPNN